MLRTILTLTLVLSLGIIAAEQASAQQARYVSDKLLVPLRSGPSGKYRITHRGLPSGLRLTVLEVSEDGSFTKIRTDRGTEGWMRSQYVQKDVPATRLLKSAEQKLATALKKNAELSKQLATIQSERSELQTEINDTGGELERITKEYSTLKTISDNAVQLDIDNRRLVEETETLKTELKRIEAENLRLNDKLGNSAFIDGALAVLLGVLITILLPRLRPAKRRSSGWA